MKTTQTVRLTSQHVRPRAEAPGVENHLRNPGALSRSHASCTTMCNETNQTHIHANKKHPRMPIKNEHLTKKHARPRPRRHNPSSEATDFTRITTKHTLVPEIAVRWFSDSPIARCYERGSKQGFWKRAGSRTPSKHGCGNH